MAFSMLIAFLYAISDFGAVAMLNVPVLTWRLYESVQNPDLLQAALLGCFLILSTLPVLLLAHRLRGKARPSMAHKSASPVRSHCQAVGGSGLHPPAPPRICWGPTAPH